MKKQYETSDSLLVAYLLCIAGGFMDAYSYVCRGGVFANAETGNIVRLGINIAEGNVYNILKYLLPIIAYSIGLALAYSIHKYLKQIEVLHWRQLSLILEIITLIGVSFLNNNFDHLANCLIAFCCAIQTVTFNKIHGQQMATTMCTGNLRNAMQALCDEDADFKRSFRYFSYIALFIVGACIGTLLTHRFHIKSILIVCLILFIVWILLFIKNLGIRENKAL